MTSEVEKVYLPIWCEGCDHQGYILVDDLTFPYFVVCQTCGWETSNVWCPDCKMGGEFVMDIRNHPSAWMCPACKRNYQLPSKFYKNSIKLQTDEELTSKVQERIKNNLKSGQSIPLQNRVRNLLVLLLLLATFFLPWVLFLTPLGKSAIGAYSILLLFIVWITRFEKLAKIIYSKLSK